EKSLLRSAAILLAACLAADPAAAAAVRECRAGHPLSLPVQSSNFGLQAVPPKRGYYPQEKATRALTSSIFRMNTVQALAARFRRPAASVPLSGLLPLSLAAGAAMLDGLMISWRSQAEATRFMSLPAFGLGLTELFAGSHDLSIIFIGAQFAALVAS